MWEKPTEYNDYGQNSLVYLLPACHKHPFLADILRPICNLWFISFGADHSIQKGILIAIIANFLIVTMLQWFLQIAAKSPLDM